MKPKILKRESVFNDYFEVEKISYESKTGETVERMVLQRPDAAALVLFHLDKNAFVFVRQFRAPALDKVTNPNILELPAGIIEKGESAESCIKRECLEETGYTVKKLKNYGTYYASPGITSERFHIFYGETDETLKAGDGGGLSSEHEDINVEILGTEAVKKAIHDGSISDAKTVIGLQNYFLIY